MPKARKRSSTGVRRSPKSGVLRWTDPRTLIYVAILCIGVVFTVVAAVQPTELRQRAATSCNESGCKNVRNGSYWMITKCNCPADPDGDQQLCNVAGKVGLCGTAQYCCPAAKQKWTTDMTACTGKVYTGVCTAPTNTPVPSSTAVPTKIPTNTPYPTYTPYPSQTPLPTATTTPRPTATPYRLRPSSTPRPTITPTPTPVPALIDACGKSCVTDADCQLGLGCTTIFAMLRACRNKSCSDKPGCLCDGNSGAFIFATPTPGPGSGALRSLLLTVGGFTDGKKQTNQTPTISGTAEPGSKVTITVYPDGIGGEVYADKNGKWTFTFNKKLNPGVKNLLVVATKPDGQAQASQQFTVVAGGGGSPVGIILLLMVLGALGFGVYVYVKSNQ